MNRMEWEKQVYSLDLAPTAKLIALVAGSFGNWTEDRTVWAGTSVIAEMAGVTRDTAQKYLDALVDQGWLVEVGKRGRASEYELRPVIAEPIGILAKTKKAMNPKSLAQLKVGVDKRVAETTGPIAETTGSGLPKREVLVADGFGSNIKELKEEEHKEEHKEVSPVPSGPVETNPLNIKKDTDSTNLWYMNGLEKQAFEATMRAYGVDDADSFLIKSMLHRGRRPVDIKERTYELLEELGLKEVKTSDDTEW